MAAAADPGPAGTFPNFMAEGTLLCRRGEYDKALACFNNALKLRAGDKHCLVARSKCYLKLGDTENSLKDAEASLQNDKTFSKGLYQKAETLYIMGDFEFALVFYHRGYRLRPELQKFRLGIEKSQEAIINCIGSPSSVKLENKGDLCFISRQAEVHIFDNGHCLDCFISGCSSEVAPRSSATPNHTPLGSALGSSLLLSAGVTGTPW